MTIQGINFGLLSRVAQRGSNIAEFADIAKKVAASGVEKRNTIGNAQISRAGFTENMMNLAGAWERSKDIPAIKNALKANG